MKWTFSEILCIDSYGALCLLKMVQQQLTLLWLWGCSLSS